MRRSWNTDIILILSAAVMIFCLTGCQKPLTGDTAAEQAYTSERQAENMNIDISPFRMDEFDGTYAVMLDMDGIYMAELFEQREDEGFLPNGYGWEALAMAYIGECCPELEDMLEFDSEADMFCVYCSDEAVLTEFITGFKSACDDSEKIAEIFALADADMC